MLRKISLLWTLFFFAIQSVAVYANSAPVYWEVSPSSSMMAVEKNTPITVLKEQLVFDFRENLPGDFSIRGRVHAEYTMKNTSNGPVTSSMVFPYFGNFWGNGTDDAVVQVDGEPVPYVRYYGKSSGDYEGEDGVFNLEEALSAIEKEAYVPQNFSPEDTGILYEVTFKNLKDQSFTGEVSFQLKAGEKMIAHGINSYSFEEEDRYAVGSFVERTAKYAVFLLGEETTIVPSAMANGEKKLVEGTDYLLEITESRQPVMRYLEKMAAESEYLGYFELKTQMERNFLLRGLDKAFSLEHLVTEDHLAQYYQEERLTLLYYETTFEPGEERKVSVTYEAEGSMDRRKTKDPLYTFQYLLTPARHFKEFHDLTVQIFPGTEHAYVLNSSLAVERQEDGSYLGTSDTLPEEDLTFTLFNQEKITVRSRVEGFFASNAYLFYFLGVIALIVFVLVIYGIGIRKAISSARKKRQS